MSQVFYIKMSHVTSICQSVTVKMVVNGKPQEFTSTGDFKGLNLDEPLYVAGVPDGVQDDYAGFSNSYSGRY